MTRRSLLAGLVLCVAGTAAAPGADWPRDSADLLARLKARDAAFDNRTVEVEQRWTERVSPKAQIVGNRFNARRFGQPDPGNPPADAIPDDFDQPHRLRRNLTSRFPEITIERVDDLALMKHPEFMAIPNRGCRWSTAGGVERVWSPETNTLHVQGEPAADGLLAWDAHMIEWASGYGMSRWIDAIDSIAIDGETMVAKGRMRLMGDDATRFEIRLDRDLIVRKATLRVPPKSGGGISEYAVETSGTERPEGGPPVAKSGRFRRILRPEGKPESVERDFEIRFVAISGRLTDEQYVERTRIVPGPGSTVIGLPARN